MSNIYRMLFLDFKKVEMVKFTHILFRFPTLNKKNPAKFSIPPTGGPPPSLNAIGKPHAVSKVNFMKKNEKGHGKNKCGVINIGKHDTMR